MSGSDRPASLMIVDDNRIDLAMLEAILSSQGYEVIAYERGEDALEAAVQNPPDLILLDILMPDMDGFEVCRRLKADWLLWKIPVIFISALEDSENKVRAFTEGGTDYVTKPLQRQEVLARVRTQITMSRMQEELQERNLRLEDLVQAKVRELEDAQMAMLTAISNLAELRDEETGQHIECTRVFCRMLAQKLQQNPRYAQEISDSFVINIYYAAPLHDIGKIGVSDTILLKPGQLTPEEFETMKAHCAIGASTLERARERYPNNAFINMGISITRSHHEKWDGSGYPDGLAGEEIPLCARIMALADVYDSLRSKSPYKEPFSREESYWIILSGAGKHFDPGIVEAFEALEPQFDEICETKKHDSGLL